MTVKDLADKLDVRVKDVLGKLLMKRLMMTINSTLDTDTATMLAREFGADVQLRTFEEELLQTGTDDARPVDIVAREPLAMEHTIDRRAQMLHGKRRDRAIEDDTEALLIDIPAHDVARIGPGMLIGIRDAGMTLRIRPDDGGSSPVSRL